MERPGGGQEREEKEGKGEGKGKVWGRTRREAVNEMEMRGERR